MLDRTRMHAVQSPIIPVVGEWIRQNPGTISLGQGVVSYPPPPQALEMLPQFLAQSQNHLYQAVEGIQPLQAAIARKLQTENRISLTEENCIVVTAGSNMAFNNALLAITEPGDEIILQTPYYFNHEMAVTIAGCRVVLVETDENYQLRLDAIADAITPRTRAVVTISPNNPTGAVYPEADLRAVNQLCGDRGIYHIHDEAYEYFTYDDTPHISPGSFPESTPHTISLFSLSKAYGFASWRIGYMVMPKTLLEAVQKIQDTILICPSVVSQYAAVGALAAGREYCKPHVAELAQVRALVRDRLSALQPKCAIAPSQGAFYFFLKLETAMSSLELVERLIREYGVAVIPGTTFGLEGGCYLRVAYGALQKETVAQGCDRLVKGIREILT